MEERGVIVIGGHIQALGIIRILGREKIPCIIIDNTSNNIARHSKYCCSSYLAKDDEILTLFKTFQDSGLYKGWIIFPTNDFHVKLLSINKPLLETYFIVSTNNWKIIEKFYNKVLTYVLAKKLDIPIPNTFFPLNETDIDKIQIEYPCIIKPAVMHSFYRKTKKKVFICNSYEELKLNYNKALDIIPANEIIIQEIINGPSKNQFSACFLFLNGKTYVSLTASRMRQHPIDFGNATTYAETINIPEIKEYGEKILKYANYNGLCEVEFKLDERDHKYKFLEVNTRTWKWHSIANKAQTPFLKTYFDFLCGREISIKEGFKLSSFYHFITDFPIQLQLFLKGFNYAFRLKKPIEHAVWAPDDFIPWFFEKIYLVYFIKNR